MLARLEKLSPREKIGVAVAVLVVCALLLNQFVVQPVVDHYKRMGATIASTRDTLRSQTGVLHEEARINAEYDAVRGMLGQAPSEAEAIDRMKAEIEREARKAGILIVSMDHRGPRDHAGCKEYVVDVSKFDADVEGLLRFLYACRTLPGMLRVPKLAVSAEKEVGKVTGSMRITKLVVVPSSN